jgi:SLOG family YspA-like protein
VDELIVIVTGGRDFTKPWRVDGILDSYHAQGKIVVVDGGCPTGADLFARQWVIKHGYRTRTHPANWRLYGDAAGPIRNGEMLRSWAHFPRVVVAAFPTRTGKGSGTQDCVNQARALGLTVENYGDVEI